MSADQLPYQVADLSLAAFGRKEIQLAERRASAEGNTSHIRTTSTAYPGQP